MTKSLAGVVLVAAACGHPVPDVNSPREAKLFSCTQDAPDHVHDECFVSHEQCVARVDAEARDGRFTSPCAETAVAYCYYRLDDRDRRFFCGQDFATCKRVRDDNSPSNGLASEVGECVERRAGQ